MSDADVRYVRETLELWIRNERDAALARWADDSTMNAPEEWPEAGRFEGAQIREVFEGFDDAFGPDWNTQMAIGRMQDLGDGRVLVEFSWNPTGASSGINLAQEITGIYTVRDGRISHADFFTSHERGRKAAGLE